jgi:tetratricopeptide (TPR) repeat protein
MLNRLLLPILLAAAFVARADQSELGQLDASPTLFTVMAALNAAGFDAGINSPDNHPLRQTVRAELAKRNIPSLPAIKEFLAKHHRRYEIDDLSQYISFALTATGPPTFAITMRDIEVPPDAAQLKDFSPLLEAFYKEANLEDLWKRAQPSIDQYIDLYHGPVTNTVLEINSYMRQQTSGFQGRRFQVRISLLAPPNIVESRSYGNNYTIVVTPSPEPRTLDIRHAYLHYLLDPMATRNKEIIERKAVLTEVLRRAPALDPSLKNDFLQLLTECLIKAVEARLDHRSDTVQQALLDGYILTPYFAEHLAMYEKQEQNMMLYYPSMVGAIDNVAENDRLAGVKFNTEPSARHLVRSAPPPAPPLTGSAKTLDQAEQLYSARDLDKAKAAYLQVLQQTDQKPMHAAAYYGLARIAVLQKDPAAGEKLFLKSLELGPEPQTKAWVLVYLGRLSLAARDNASALRYFQDALKVEGASEMARNAATQGVQTSSKQ